MALDFKAIDPVIGCQCEIVQSNDRINYAETRRDMFKLPQEILNTTRFSAIRASLDIKNS